MTDSATTSPGRTYRLEGHEGFYTVFVEGERVGFVAAGFETWTAMPIGRDWRRCGRWAWTAPTRREALAGLLRHLGIEP